MKRFCLISLLLISVFFLFSVKTGNAATVDFDCGEYLADAEADGNDNDDRWYTYKYVGQSFLPVSAEVDFTRTDYSAFASASTPDGINFYTSTEALNNLSDPQIHVSSSAYMETYLYFTATAPFLHVSFDYFLDADLDVSGSGSGSGAEAWAYPSIYLSLVDDTTGDSVYEWGEEIDDAELDTGSYSYSITDSFNDNDYFDVTPDKEYYLYLNLSSGCAVDGYADAFNSANLTNLQIEAVPLPSAVLLLGSGLICLVALRRKSS